MGGGQRSLPPASELGRLGGLQPSQLHVACRSTRGTLPHTGRRRPLERGPLRHLLNTSPQIAPLAVSTPQGSTVAMPTTLLAATPHEHEPLAVPDLPTVHLCR